MSLCGTSATSKTRSDGFLSTKADSVRRSKKLLSKSSSETVFATARSGVESACHAVSNSNVLASQSREFSACLKSARHREFPEVLSKGEADDNFVNLRPSEDIATNLDLEVAPSVKKPVDLAAVSRKRVRQKLREEVRAARKAKKRERKLAQLRRGVGEDLNEFRNKTQARVVQQIWSELPQVRSGLISLGASAQAPEFVRRRIAIVGAGPVGLWTALLLAQKYAGGVGHNRRPDAPEIMILEARSKETHCARTDIRIALSSSTQSLLNQRTESQCFSSGMPIAEIESHLLDSLQKQCPRQTLTFGHPVDNPINFVDSAGFDCILWAGGRRSLNSDLRASLGCEQRIGKSEKTLVFHLNHLAEGGDVWQFTATAGTLQAAVRQAGGPASLRVMFRPGLGGASAGWLWLFGLPTDLVATRSSTDSSAPSQTMVEALEAVLDDSHSPSASSVRSAVEILQQRIRPTACTVNWVDAAFWSSDRVACDLERPDSSEPVCPIVLLGDAAFGKPFYTGSTLNRHFWDAAHLVDSFDWIHDGSKLTSGFFSAYERRYQAELQRITEYGRRCAFPALANPSEQPPQPQLASTVPPEQNCAASKMTPSRQRRLGACTNVLPVVDAPREGQLIE